MGCKDDTPYADVSTTEVEMHIQNPLADATIISGQDLTHLDGRIDANAKMGGWGVDLINEETGEIVESFEEYYEHTQFIVHHHWFFEYTDTMHFEIQVRAITVQMDTLATKSIHITCLPE